MTTTVRRAIPADAEGIARTFLESAEYHAALDPERYSAPALGTILAHYRDVLQQSSGGEQGITLVAEFNGEILGFIDVRLERSKDLMHREMVYCHVSEIAVGGPYQGQGIGARLMQAAEDWGCKMGAEFASLEFHTANDRAGLFYQERLGYRPAAITAIKRL